MTSASEASDQPPPLPQVVCPISLRLDAGGRNSPAPADTCFYQRLHDDRWTILAMGEECLEMLGLQSDHLISNARVSYVDLVHPDDREWIDDCLQRAIAQRRP